MTTTRPETFRITDESTKAEVAEAITHLGRRASREMPAIGDDEHPTPWDLRHQAINMLLLDWEPAPDLGR